MLLFLFVVLFGYFIVFVSQVEKSKASLDLNPALVVWVQWQL
jgi:hypothetical protein